MNNTLLPIIYFYLFIFTDNVPEGADKDIQIRPNTNTFCQTSCTYAAHGLDFAQRM